MPFESSWRITESQAGSVLPVFSSLAAHLVCTFVGIEGTSKSDVRYIYVLAIPAALNPLKLLRLDTLLIHCDII